MPLIVVWNEHAGVAEMAEDLFKTLRPGIEECMQSSRKLVLVGHSLGEIIATASMSKLLLHRAAS